MKKEKDLYFAIKEIANSQHTKKEQITRSDVAAILRSKYKFDVQDGMALSEAIYNAYKEYDDSQIIRVTIISNNEKTSVVDLYEMNISLDRDDRSQTICLVKKDLEKTESAIENAQKEVSNVLEIKTLSTELIKEFSGYGEIEKIQKKSASLMQNYSQMVFEYQNAEECVKTDVRDFLLLRSSINDKFLQYSSALVDVFGESIKVISPQLFDFNNIKWLDVSLMQKEKQLQYDKLDENCTILIGEIAQHFQKTMSQVPVWMKGSKSLGKGGSVCGGLVAAAFSFLNHYLDAAEKTTQMEREFLKFKDSIVKDRILINSDLMRVATIHKTLNDVLIPQADTFLKYCDQVMSEDLNKVIDSIYTNETLPLKSERDGIIKRLKVLEQSINDHNEWISYFNNRLVDCNNLLASKKDLYEKAMSEKPSEPSFIGKVFNSKSYERKLYEWNKMNGVLVDAYEETQIDVYEATQDFNSHQKSLDEEKHEYENLKLQLLKLNKRIAEKLVCDNHKKIEVLKHLKKLITMLQAGKAILEDRLDDSLLDVRKIKEIEYQLPKQIEEQVNNFVNDTCTNLKNSGFEISQSVLNNLGIDSADISVEQINTIQETVKKTSDILKNITYLQREEIRSKLTREAYEKEFKRMKSEFQQTIKQIDDKNEIIMKAIQKANNSDNKEELRKALIELTGSSEFSLTEFDFDKILKGEKAIEI